MERRQNVQKILKGFPERKEVCNIQKEILIISTVVVSVVVIVLGAFFD